VRWAREVAVAIGLVAASSAAACKGDEAADGPDTERPVSADQLEAIAAEPSVPALLALLGRTHALTIDALGAHRLSYEATFDLNPDGPIPRPKVDQPVVVAQSVTDRLELSFASAAPLRFSLTQSNDRSQARDVIVVDERVYTRLPHGEWLFRPLETDHHRLWLDDAQRCVHDLVELAAPRVAITPPSKEDLEGRPVWVFDLGLSEAVDPDLVAPGERASWRHAAEIDAVEGSVSIDASTGVWRRATLEVRYRVRDSAGRTLTGRATLSAALDPAPEESVVVSAPDGAKPQPERIRPLVERDRLLDGLAGR
jgi:hypothetical protein